MTRTCRIGVNGRNAPTWGEADFQAVGQAKLEAVKLMGFTDKAVAQRLIESFPDIRLLVRLYAAMGQGDPMPPADFVAHTSPQVARFEGLAARFEVHNEPNHLDGVEGWGQEDHHAQAFNDWFLEVYEDLKANFPWAEFGFPGLAIPHRDLEWLDICQEAIETADWLGCHCYWQNPTGDEGNHLSDFWGLRFLHYHGKYPSKVIEITEFGNSNCQSGYPVDNGIIAAEYAAYYQELFKYGYLGSASAFILSAPQREWRDFCWRTEGGGMKSVVAVVGAIPRPELVEPEPETPPAPTPAPTPTPGPSPAPAPSPTPTPAPTPASGADWIWLPVLDEPLNLNHVAFVTKDGTCQYGVFDMIKTLPPEDTIYARAKIKEVCR